MGLLVAEDPDWVSINNGVFICQKCANLHKALNDNEVSFPRPICADFWSP